MMIDGIDYGREHIVVVQKGYQVVTDGTVNKIPFNKLPAKVGNKHVIVRRLIVDGPVGTVSLPAQKTIDGIHAAEQIKQISLSLSPLSPPAKAGDGGNVLIEPIDGYRGLSALSWLTGEKLFNAPGDVGAWSMATNNALSPNGTLQPAQIAMRDQGWLQYQGPFAFNDHATDAKTATLPSVFVLPLIPYEESDAAGFPGLWFNDDANCGSLDIAYNSTAGNLAITWTGTSVTIYAEVLLVDDANVPVPAPWKIEAFLSGEKQLRFREAPTSFLAFVKPLSSGDVPAEDYSDVRMYVGGQELDYYDPATMGLFHTLRDADRAELGYGHMYPKAITNALGQSTRYTGFGVCMIAASKLSRARGGDHDFVTATVNTTGETTFKGVQISHQLRSLPVATAAAKGLGMEPAATAIGADSKSGTTIPAGKGIARILPARLGRMFNMGPNGPYNRR